MLQRIINTIPTSKGKLCGLSKLISGRVSAFVQLYGPCTQADTQPDTSVDNLPRIPFSVSFVYITSAYLGLGICDIESDETI